MITAVVLQFRTLPELWDRLFGLSSSVGVWAVNLGVGLGVLLAGWLAALLVSRLVSATLHLLRFDTAMSRLAGAQPAHEPSRVVGWAVYWLTISAASVLTLEVLGFSLAASVAARLSEVVPRIVTSAVLFGVGALIAILSGGVTRRFLASAEIRAARIQGQVVTVVLTGFAALLALEQLGFAAQFVMSVGLLVVGAAGVGLALAFGLGCRDLVRDFLIEYLRSLEDDGPRRPS